MIFLDRYSFNIKDILRRWGKHYSAADGYPSVGHCGEYSQHNILNVGSAINAGVVELKCFINNQCPFNKSEHHEDSIMFNYNTIEKIKPFLHPYYREGLMSHKGLDGIFFTPKFVYRHNYIFRLKPGVFLRESYFPSINDENFYDNYEEIGGTGSSNIFGSAHTRYKDEQSWIVQKSVFDKDDVEDLSEDISSSECAEADWEYLIETVNRSDETEQDVSFDYRGNYYQQQLRYYREEDKRDPKILKKSIQVPTQTKIYSDRDGMPIHWRVIKKTPLFRGEDFFITFYKKASRPTTVNNDTQFEQLHPFNRSVNNIAYKCLDVTDDRTIKGDTSRNVRGKRGEYERRVNEAVFSMPILEQDVSEEKQHFNFYNQAYYIIEMGYLCENANYYIIITERNSPIFVMVQKLGDGYVSTRLSEFSDITGKELIDSRYFTVIVRNHLGKLSVVFSSEKGDTNPWIISRSDIVPYYDELTKSSRFRSIMRDLYVPRGLMTIWGGNIKCGFSFSPLQYKIRSMGFTWPPRVDDNITRSRVFSLSDPENIERNKNEIWEDIPFYLPMDEEGTVKHNILLSASDKLLPELFKDFHLSNIPSSRNKLFIQDAQCYREYSESGRSPIWDYGGFMFGRTLREDSDIVTNYLNRSVLCVRKNRYEYDRRSRKQAFDISVGMQAGDHIFTNSYWGKIFDEDKAEWGVPPANPFMSPPNGVTLPDDQWYLPDCKTPILNSIRLIAEESRNPRWEDGTSIARGVSPFPNGGGVSPYFLDVSNHILSYSDSWSSNGWSEVEHNGSINFYLHTGVDSFGEGGAYENKSIFLRGLQNKTFYIEIWARYRPCLPDGFNLNTGMYGFYKLFTGLCHGGEMVHEYNKHVFTCKLEDYTTVLKGMKFYNAPWFDGMRDISAVWEVLRMSGFRSRGKFDPASLIREMDEYSRYGNIYHGHDKDGRFIIMEPYALPSGYERLEQPAFKPEHGSVYYDIINDFANRSGKVFFFDQFGVAHYEEMQNIVEKDFRGEVPLDNYVLFEFTTNPNFYGGQLLLEKIERVYDVRLISNHIKVVTNTPDMHLLVRDALNWASFENPNSEGFMGYLKSHVQHEGMYGSREALINIVNKYKVMFRPVVRIKFETYGVPLRANDIIRVDGETVRVINVNHSLDASKNEWRMTVEAHRYQPIIY